MTTEIYFGNVRRGCGHMVKSTRDNEVFYLEASMSTSGALRAWTWAAGWGLEGAPEFARGYCKVNPQGVTPGDAAATLLAGEFIPAGAPVEESELYQQVLKSIGSPVVLIDHVGSNHYTPYSFIREVMAYGPSRRINKALALEIAQHQLPIPVMFTSGLVPVFRDYNDWLELTELVTGEPTEPRASWLNPDWGLTRQFKDRGGSHPMTLIHKEIDAIRGRKTFTPQDRVSELLGSASYIESVIGFSWFNRVTRTLGDHEDYESVAKRMAEQNVRVIDLNADNGRGYPSIDEVLDGQDGE